VHADTVLAGHRSGSSRQRTSSARCSTFPATICCPIRPIRGRDWLHGKTALPEMAADPIIEAMRVAVLLLLASCNGLLGLEAAYRPSSI